VVARSAPPTRDEVMRILGEVMDPEVPVISVVELGIVRDVAIDGSRVTVTVTPTYSGCPALQVIEDDIRSALVAHGISDVKIEMVYAPAWTTDWIGPEAREKLRVFGIAPPGPAEVGGLITLTRRRAVPKCPRCGSTNTELQSEFGSTACKALHVCRECGEPFDEFKAI